MKFALLFLLFLLFFVPIGSSLSAKVYVVTDESGRVLSGQILRAILKVKYPENKIRKDLNFKYMVLDEGGRVVVSEAQTEAIQTQGSFLGEIKLPEDLSSGNYRLRVEISDGERLDEFVETTFGVGASSSGRDLLDYLLYVFAALLFVGILLIIDIFLHRKRINQFAG